jgi:predicted nucleotidyltransferase
MGEGPFLHVDNYAERIMQAIVEWAKAQPTIQAVAVVGSYARGTARAGSDIDLVLVATDPQVFLADIAWIDAIDWNTVGPRPMKWQDEDYGRVWSRRLWLNKNGGEIEVTFASLSWADVNSLDPGTQRVIADGCRILHDPKELLNRLCATVSSGLR